MVKFSIIIPVYNSEKHLKQCLDSVIKQTLTSIEIICIDDSSCDNSFNILQEYAQIDNRFIIIKNDRQRKQGYSRNLGIQKAKGEFIHFLDSDDYLIDKNFYQDCYNKLHKNNIDVFIFNYYEYHADLNKLIKSEDEKIFPFLYKNQSLYQNKKLILSGMPWDKIYKRKFLIEHNVIFAEDCYWEDILFNFLIKINNPNIMLTNKQYIVYRLNDSSSVTTHIKYIFDDCIKMAEYSKKVLEDRNLYNKHKLEFLQNYFGALYFDILQRLKEESGIRAIFGLIQIKKFYERLQLHRNDLDNMYDYDNAIYTIMIKLQKLSLYSELAKYFFQQIFSITNTKDKRHKEIRFIGFKFKIKGVKYA